MIRLTSLSKVYRTNEIETLALENVNLEINDGEFISIMGPSGCGKSTLLNLISSPMSPTAATAATEMRAMRDRISLRFTSWGISLSIDFRCFYAWIRSKPVPKGDFPGI